MIGPQIGANLMAHFKIHGAFYLMAAAVPLLPLMAGLGTFDDASRRAPGSAFAILAPRAGPLAHDPLDPQGQPAPPRPQSVGP